LGSLVRLNIVPSTQCTHEYKITGSFIGIATLLPIIGYEQFKLLHNYITEFSMCLECLYSLAPLNIVPEIKMIPSIYHR